MAPFGGSVERNNNGQPGRWQRSKERWDTSWSAEGISGVQQGTIHTINEWQNEWGLSDGSEKQYKIDERGARGVADELVGLQYEIDERGARGVAEELVGQQYEIDERGARGQQMVRRDNIMGEDRLMIGMALVGHKGAGCESGA